VLLGFTSLDLFVHTNGQTYADGYIDSAVGADRFLISIRSRVDIAMSICPSVWMKDSQRW